MIAVLARLQWMTLKGRVVRSLRLLRQPKYLIGSVVGFGWIGLWVIRPMLHSKMSIGAMPHGATDAAYLPAIHRIAALAVSVVLPLPWLLPWGRLGLPFRESELTMLLQAPLSRRQVIQYGLLKSEAGVIFGALVLSFFLGTGGPLARLFFFLGTWILFEFWHLNGKWRALFNLHQTEIGISQARLRRSLLAVGVLAYYVLLVVALLPFPARIVAAFAGATGAGISTSLVTLTWPPLLVAVLTPAWWLTAPMFAGGGVAFVAAALPSLLAVVAQREIVLRSRARFEESALEHAQEAETKKSPKPRHAKISSRGRLRQPFPLHPRGSPEFAVLWKNAIRVSRVPWVRAAVAGSVLLIAIAVLPAVLRLSDVTYAVLAFAGAIFLFAPPLVSGMGWNNDLRTELAHIELVRTWPVSAERFVLAEVISPALLSIAASTFGAGLLLTSLFGSRLRQALTGEPTSLHLLPRGGEFLGVSTAMAAVVLVVSVLPMAAAASFFSSSIQNLAVVWAPAWMAHSADRSQGVAAFGQRMVFSIGLGLAFMLALIPSALLIGAAALLQHAIGIPWSAWAFPFWGLIGSVPLFAGGWLVVRATASFWERLDPSEEVLEIGR